MIRIIHNGERKTIQPLDGKDIVLAIWDTINTPQASLTNPGAVDQKVGK